ncbi:Zinc-finger homeodomain protein 2 [Linum perenne]
MEEGTQVYKECLRNHAASLGSYATDGCGEFTLSAAAALQCAACGCHRNFHRKVNTTNNKVNNTTNNTSMKPMTSPAAGRRNRTKFTAEQKERMTEFAEKIGWRLSRVTNKEEDDVEMFCRGIGVSRHVFKVWMHNHKNSSSSSSTSNINNINNNNNNDDDNMVNYDSSSNYYVRNHHASSLTTR